MLLFDDLLLYKYRNKQKQLEYETHNLNNRNGYPYWMLICFMRE